MVRIVPVEIADTSNAAFFVLSTLSKMRKVASLNSTAPAVARAESIATSADLTVEEAGLKLV